MQDAKAISAVIGVIAGIASALLLAGAHQPSTFSLVLIAAASLPILIAGLGWSNIASIAAVASACVVISVTTSPLAALSAALTSLAPAAWIAHLNNLARPATEIGGPEGRTAWYPLSDILFHVSALMTVALIILGLLVGYGPEMASQMVDMIIKLLNEQDPSINITPDIIARMKAILVNLLPVMQGAMWVGILFGMYALARSIVRLSGRSKRPADDFAAQLRMPRTGLGICRRHCHYVSARTFQPCRLGHYRHVWRRIYSDRFRADAFYHARQKLAVFRALAGLFLSGFVHRATASVSRLRAQFHRTVVDHDTERPQILII